MAGLLLLLGACGDDGNDLRAQTERAEILAAEFASTTTDAVLPAVSGDVSDTSGAVVADPSVEPSGVVVPVLALDNTFRPDIVEVSVGDQVLWENRGLNEHNVLEVEGDDWGVEVEDFQAGDVYAHTFTEPGEYRYFCSIHGIETVGMIGVVIVTE